ncbi:Serine/threonine-protein phosphatase 5 [Anas platyrhynchos]|uniref:protein-serine/threonine phosphatase n=1 Tax=Anas platyrhynchos TaxID=8839 RepID=R0J7K2_ANAPL|nr:Serine/threonine-protein phosphatase 5 [Anas platyrhynchos]
MALGKFKAALRDYETVVKVRPNDKDAKLKYQECNKIVKQKAFERAIASDEQKRSVVDSLDIESMTIEDEYSGPKLEDGKVTLAFMKDLMQWYKGTSCAGGWGGHLEVPPPLQILGGDV